MAKDGERVTTQWPPPCEWPTGCTNPRTTIVMYKGQALFFCNAHADEATVEPLSKVASQTLAQAWQPPERKRGRPRKAHTPDRRYVRKGIRYVVCRCGKWEGKEDSYVSEHQLIADKKEPRE